MISEGYFRRHVQAAGNNREVALLDVAQEYILEHLRREGLFDQQVIVFKGGTALRKFLFGREGRFSVDLDFALLPEDSSYADFVLDLLNGAEISGVRVQLERRRGLAALLRIETALGSIAEPAAISIRPQRPWLPAKIRDPLPFEFLDRGLASDFTRAPLPILDTREIAAEKIAAFWRRRMARDLYDLEHLGRVLQADFDGPAIAEIAALKIYFDVVDEGLGRLPGALSEIFSRRATDVTGADDLGRFRAALTDVKQLLARCAQRYQALADLDGEFERLATTGSPRDRNMALTMKDTLVARLTTPTTKGGRSPAILDGSS